MPDVPPMEFLWISYGFPLVLRRFARTGGHIHERQRKSPKTRFKRAVRGNGRGSDKQIEHGKRSGQKAGRAGKYGGGRTNGLLLDWRMSKAWCVLFSGGSANGKRFSCACPTMVCGMTRCRVPDQHPWNICINFI